MDLVTTALCFKAAADDGCRLIGRNQPAPAAGQAAHLVYVLCVPRELCVQRLLSIGAARLATRSAHQLRHLQGATPAAGRG
jgi:hypothetical protein